MNFYAQYIESGNVGPAIKTNNLADCLRSAADLMDTSRPRITAIVIVGTSFRGRGREVDGDMQYAYVDGSWRILSQ